MTDGGEDATKTIHPSLGSDSATPGAPGDERPLARGTEVGRYVILSVVGGGGMGFVYSAFDPELDRRVALKLLRRTAAAPDAHARLLREAQAMARLSHPNVVTVYDAGMHEGRVFLAMEFVAGATLREWLEQRPRSFKEKLYALVEAGKGLAAAHAAHLVHRDVKPANVIVGEDGRVRVTDFGIARSEQETKAARTPEGRRGPDSESLANLERVRDASWSEALTREGAVVGTMGYLSPEQAESKASDARTDQFSFCVTAWEVLYGQRPFPRETVEAYIAALLAGAVTPPPASTDVPRRVQAALKKGLSVAPEGRFPKMEALLEELQRDPSRRLWALAPWALLVALLVALIAGLSISQARRAQACTGFDAQLAGRWDASVRAKLEQTFAAVKTPWSADVLKSVERGLDTWTQAWLSQKQAACEATVVAGKQTAEVRALRDGCLQRRLDELGALTGALVELEAAGADKAVSAVYALHPPSLCADTSRLRAPSSAREAKAVRDELDKGLARLELGQLQKAEPYLQKAVKDAGEQKLQALSAEALLGLGGLEQQKAAFDDAHVHDLGALKAALAAGLDELVARAALRLALIVGFHEEKVKEGRDWLAVADGAIERLGGDPLLSMQRLQAEGVLAFSAGDALAAAKKHEEALALGKAALGDDHPSLWKAYLDLGTSYMSAREYPKAVPMLEEALRRREAAVGSEHPEVALVLANLGTARFYAGDAEGSAKALQRSLEVREKILGPDSPRLVPLLANMGDTALRSGRLRARRWTRCSPPGRSPR